MRRSIVLCAAILVVSGVGCRAGAQAQLEILPHLTKPGSELWFSTAHAVSWDGSRVAGETLIVDLDTQTGHTYAAVWEGNGSVAGDPLDTAETGAVAISADGRVVLGRSYCCGCGTPGEYRWYPDGSVDVPTGADTPYFYCDFGRAMSADGSLVVGRYDKYYASCDAMVITQAFRWGPADILRGLDASACELPGGIPPSDATAVNAGGSVIGGTYGTGGFRWTSTGGFVGIPGMKHAPVWISLDGGTMRGDGFRWDTIHGYVEDHALDGAVAFSGDGEMFIAASANGSTYQHVGDAQRPLRDMLMEEYGLDLRGWCLKAEALSLDGSVVVGQAVTPDEESVAFRVRIGAPTGGWCVADIDRSGFVDLDDFVQFVGYFDAGDRRADFNGSCYVDLEDFGDFVDRFTQGC